MIDLMKRGVNQKKLCEDKLARKAIVLISDAARTGGLMLYEDEAQDLVKVISLQLCSI